MLVIGMLLVVEDGVHGPEVAAWVQPRFDALGLDVDHGSVVTGSSDFWLRIVGYGREGQQLRLDAFRIAPARPQARDEQRLPIPRRELQDQVLPVLPLDV